MVPVLLIHGIGDTSKFFRTLATHLKKGGLDAHSIDLVPNNGDVGLDRLARQIDSYVASQFSTTQKIDLIGFSMGGIVSRYYIQRLGGIDRVRRFITISSPHRGTWTAYLRANPGVRQMRPGSAFLRNLNDDLTKLDRVGFVSLWTPFDLMILPSSSSVLPVGQSVRVAALAHPLMVKNRRVLQLVHELLVESA